MNKEQTDALKEAEKESGSAMAQIEVKVTGGKFNSKKKEFETSFLETEDFYFEQIINERYEHTELSTDIYIRYPKHSKEKIEYVDDFKHNGITYKPISGKLTSYKIVNLPTGIVEYGSDDELVKDISNFLFKYFEPPKFYETVLPYLLFFYWISDKFPFLQYLHFAGLTGTGKSTALETFGSICYKSINCSGNISISSLFRLAHTWRGTLLLDEFDLGSKNSENYSALLQILRGGTSDIPVFRTEGDRKKEVDFYLIKAPRVFSSQSAIEDAALSSRTLVVKMNKNQKRLPLYKLDNFKDEAQVLRNKLLLWRLRHLNKIDLSKFEYGFPELANLDMRTQQIISPLYFLGNEKTKKEILDFGTQQELSVRQERLDELEGQVFIFIQEHAMEEVMIGDVTKFLNDKRESEGYRSKLTERKIGNVVRKILGFSTERASDGRYRIVINQDKVDELSKYYGLEDIHISTVSSERSVSPDSASDTANVKEKTPNFENVPKKI